MPFFLPSPQVLTLDRSLVVTASTSAPIVLDRNTFTSAGPASLSRHNSAASSGGLGSMPQSQSQQHHGQSGGRASSLVTVAPFDAACPNTLALPSICLVDATQAVAFAATLGDQLYLELAWDGSAVALRIKDVNYYNL